MTIGVTITEVTGNSDARNFGYGRQLSYAGPQALKAMFGDGHYPSMAVAVLVTTIVVTMS